MPASGGNTPRQVLLIADFAARILCCTPSYALNIADTMAASGIDPRDNTTGFEVLSAAAVAFTLGVSADGHTWTSVYDTTAGTGGVMTITLPAPVTARWYA